MKISKSFALLLVTGSLTSLSAFAESPSTYEKYLGPECSEGRYADHNFKPKAMFQVALGASEGMVGALNLRDIKYAKLGGKWFVPQVVLIGDGLGRLLGGACAGLTGLDDLVVASASPAIEAGRGIKRNFFKSSAVTAENKSKLLPSDVTAGAELLSAKTRIGDAR